MLDLAVVGTEPWMDPWVGAAVERCPCGVRAVWDALPDRAASLARTFGAPACGGGAEAVLVDGRIGAVLLGPRGGSLRLAGQALALGRHVWLGCPPALHSDDLRPLRALAAAKGLALGAGPGLRHGDLARTVREIVDAGQVGRPVLVDWEDLAVAASPRWGLLAGCDLVTWLLGVPAATVCADVRSAGGREYARVQMRAEGGAIGVCAVSRPAAEAGPPWQALTVIGTRGQLRFDTRLTGLLHLDGAGAHPLPGAGEDGLALDLACWLAAVAEGRPTDGGACSPDGLRLAAAVDRSLQVGDAVRVGEGDRG